MESGRLGGGLLFGRLNRLDDFVSGNKDEVRPSESFIPARMLVSSSMKMQKDGAGRRQRPYGYLGYKSKDEAGIK